MPFVYEEVGGKEEDWDNELFCHFDKDALIGIIVQVKSGAIKSKELFEKKHLEYNLKRLGIESSSSIDSILPHFESLKTMHIKNDLGQKCQIAKLLIAKVKPRKRSTYLYHSLKDIHSFIQKRINKYPKEKYRDRLFFSSIALQTLIEKNYYTNKKQGN